MISCWYLIITEAPVKEFKESSEIVFFAEPSFFKIFDFPLLAGSYASLKDPNNVLLTKEIAEKYFGDWKTAIGKTIKLRVGGYIFEHGTDVLKVSGILASIPANTDFQLKIVVAFGTSFTGSYLEKSTDWAEAVPDFGCYICCRPILRPIILTESNCGRIHEKWNLPPIRIVILYSH